MIFTAQEEFSQGALIYFCKETKQIKPITTNDEMLSAMEAGLLIKNAEKKIKKGKKIKFNQVRHDEETTELRLKNIRKLNGAIRKMDAGHGKADAIRARDRMARNVSGRFAETRDGENVKM